MDGAGWVILGLSEPAIGPQFDTTHAGLRYPAYTPTSSTVPVKRSSQYAVTDADAETR